MQGYINITVRVASARALAQMKQVQAATAGVSAAQTRANAAPVLGLRQAQALTKWGSQLQWAGRQIQYNFTLPLALAAGAVTKWELDNEKAFVHVKKVYGDTAAAAAYFRKHQEQIPEGMNATQAASASFRSELRALDKAFVAISNRYGVQQKDVLEVAGAWAAAGQSGKALAESVNQTMKAVIIGDMDAADATQALIAIQAQYNLNSKQLGETLADLNAIENQTGIDMKGLIDGFARTAGVARAAGIDVRHLGALLAALVPATGSAANAGNALKTILSRMMAPTKEAVQVMHAMGLEINSKQWQSSTALERLQLMAKEFNALPASAKNAASSVIASRWQINKFNVLMGELNPQMSYYEKALDATANRQKVFNIMQQELNQVLSSNPQRLKQMWVIMQNALTNVIQPLLPYLIYIVNEIKNLVLAFSNMNPQWQKFIMLMLAGIAAFGLIGKYIGATAVLFGLIGRSLEFAGMALGIFSREVVTSTGATVIARKGILQMLGALTVRPIMLFGGAMMTMLGAISGVLTRFVLFGPGFIMATLKTWQAMWLGILAITKSRLIQLQLLQAAGAFEGLTVWQKFWRLMQALWAVGFTGLFGKILKLGALVKVWQLIGTGIIGTWKAAWVSILAINTAGTVAVEAETAAAGVATVGIWSRIGAALKAVWFAITTTVTTLFSGMGARLGAIAMRIVPLLLSPWTLLAAAVVALLYAFRKQIAQIWQNIVNYFANSGNALPQIWQNIVGAIVHAFDALPQGVQNALIAVVRIVHDAAMQVYEWFSYLNPFAHHSPSLVENVKNGMGAVNNHMQTVQQSGQHFKAAHQHVEAYGSAVAKVGGGGDAINQLVAAQTRAEQASNAKDIAKVSPAAAKEYLHLAKVINALTPKLNALNAAVEHQQKVVDKAQAAVDRWDAKLEAAQKRLQALQDVADKWSGKLQDAQNALSTFASTPLKGMQAMNDKIHANDMAQKKLQWQMMQMEKVTGPLDQIQSKLDGINAAQELLRGEQTDLRNAGAGSEILSQYDDQIKALDQTKNKYTEQTSAISDMQAQLDALQQKADELDLQKSLKFDDLTYQIDKASQTMKEMPFDQIMKGIQGAQADIGTYTGKLNQANAAVAKQQKVVDALTKHRDAAQKHLDAEQKKLDAVKKRYDNLSNTIQKLQDKMQSAEQAASSLNSAMDKKKGNKPYVSPGLANFRTALKGNFPDPGGAGLELRKNWANQSKGIDKFTNQLANQTAGMFKGLNPFAPLKKKFSEVWTWIKARYSDIQKGLTDFFSHAFAGVHLGDMGGIKKALGGTMKFLTKMLHDISGFIHSMWQLFGPDVKRIIANFVKGFQDIWKKVGPQLAAFGDLIAPLGDALKGVWKVAKVIFIIMAARFIFFAKIIASVVGHIIKPALDMIGDILSGMIRIVRGLLQILIGIFTLNFGMIAKGVGNIFRGLWDELIGLLKGAVKIIANAVWGLVTGIIGFFHWLWDKMIGHSIIPDLINGIIWYFNLLVAVPKWLWKHVVLPIVHFFEKLWDLVKKGLKAWWKGIQAAWKGLKEAGAWLKKHVWQPVIDAAKWVWDREVKGFKQWWEWLKKAWDKLKGAGKWIWDNVFVKVFNMAKSLWSDHVKPEFKDWWSRITGIWNSLKRLGGWIKSNVMDPIFTAIKSGWQRVKDWLIGAKDLLTNPAKNIMNGAISAVNWLIKGLNKISDILPGINFHIDVIQQMADGGQVPRRRVGSGFKTNGARAIVGEGKANYPEFVIPTDPTYRRRARQLHAMAGQKLGMQNGGAWGETSTDKNKIINGVPAYDIGGVLGSIGDIAKGTGSWIKGKITTLASLPFKPFKAYAENKIAGLDWNVAKAIAKYGLNQVLSWVHLADQDAEAAAKQIKKRQAKKSGYHGNLSPNARIQKAQRFAISQVGDPYVWGGVGPNGFDCSGFMNAITNVLQGMSPYVRRWGATSNFPWAHFAPGFDKKGFTIGSTNNYGGSGIGHMAGTLAGMNVESRGGTGVIVGSGARGWNDPGFSKYDYLTGLQYGGIVRRRAGGLIARLGEGTHDEAVTPLPHGWRGMNGSKSGETHIHINGDLSFPNITSGEDAETFIENLKILAKD